MFVFDLQYKITLHFCFYSFIWYGWNFYLGISVIINIFHFILIKTEKLYNLGRKNQNFHSKGIPKKDCWFYFDLFTTKNDCILIEHSLLRICQNIFPFKITFFLLFWECFFIPCLKYFWISKHTRSHISLLYEIYVPASKVDCIKLIKW